MVKRTARIALLLSSVSAAAAPLAPPHGRCAVVTPRFTPSQSCSTLDKDRPPLSVSFESTDDRAWAGDRYVEGVLLRLTNNTDCPVFLEAPPDELRYFRVRDGRAVRLEVGEVRDKQRISLKYLVKYPDRDHPVIGGFGGDVLDFAKLDAGNHVLFSVPLSDFRAGGELRLPFRYEWEIAADARAVSEEGGPGRGVKAAEHYVTFAPEMLPVSALR
jgi:hypothetical protein